MLCFATGGDNRDHSATLMKNKIRRGADDQSQRHDREERNEASRDG
jgi:hypothetical protein